MILEHPGGVPDRLSENCQNINIRRFSKVLEKYSKSTPREVQILSKYCQNVLRGQFSDNILIKYGPKRGAAAEAAAPLLGAAEGRDHIFIKILSGNCPRSTF